MQIVRDAVLDMTGYDLEGPGTDEDRSEDEARNTIHERIRKLGYRVEMGTPYCDQFRAAHPENCTGCESHDGCYASSRLAEMTMKYLRFVALMPVRQFVDVATQAYRDAVAEVIVPPAPTAVDQLIGEGKG